MSMRAMMIKTESPAMDLYLIKSLSEEQLQFANSNFEKRGLPYKVVRLSDEAAA